MESFVIGLSVGAVSGASAMLTALYMMMRVRFVSDDGAAAE